MRKQFLRTNLLQMCIQYLDEKFPNVVVDTDELRDEMNTNVLWHNSKDYEYARCNPSCHCPFFLNGERVCVDNFFEDINTESINIHNDKVK
jgi:hypothetical protein